MEPKDIVTICFSSASLLIAGSGLALSIYNYRRARDRYEGTGTTMAVGLDDQNRIHYQVVVTNTGNRPLTIDSVVCRSEGGRTTEVASGITVGADSSERVDFYVLPDQPQPVEVEVVPHKGERFQAPVQKKQVAKRVFSETLSRYLRHSFGDLFDFEPGDRPDTILATVHWERTSDKLAFPPPGAMQARHRDGESPIPATGVGRVVLDCNVLFDGGDELCELPTDRTREAMWLLTEGNTILGQFSRSRPEGGNPKYCLTVNERGKEGVKNPFELLSTLYKNRALEPKVYKRKIKVLG